MELVMLTTLPPRFCEHLLHGQLCRINKAIQIGGRQRPEVLGCVLGKGLRKEDPGVVHQCIDRAEPLYRGSNDHLGRRGQTDVAVDEGQLIRALQLVLMSNFSRITHHVVAAIEEQVGNRGHNSLRGSRHNDGLLSRSHMNLRVWLWLSVLSSNGGYCRTAQCA
jgi:hypothetical protein